MVRIRDAALGVLWGCSALDREPPTLSVTLPVEVARGEIAIEIEAHDASAGLDSLSVTVDGEPLARAPDGWRFDTRTRVDGSHTVRVSARDRSIYGNEVVWQGSFSTDNTAPEFSLAPAAATQGRTLVLWVTASEPVTDAVALLDDRRISMYPVQDRWRGLVGVDLRAQIGLHPLEIEAVDAAGNLGRAALEYTVHPGEFAAGGRILLTAAQVAARKDEEAKAKTRREREAAYAHDEPRQLWTQPFVRPVEARTSSPFGRYRSYSDGTRSYHTGMDLAARRRTPVASAASGRVLVAGWQAIFGNVVIVHHGQGLTTSYNHLDEVRVAVGEPVEGGDIIGLLGSTGQSTGPHLHWGVTVAETAVDPAEWLDAALWRMLERPPPADGERD